MKTVCVLLLFVALAAPGFAQAPDDKLVVPGQRIRKWTLDMTIDDLERVTGARHAGGIMVSSSPVIRATEYSRYVYGEIGDWTEDVWFHFWDRQSLYAGTLSRDDQQVVFLGIYLLEGFRTSQGITIGTPRQDVETVYGYPTARTDRRVIYDHIGLAVRMRIDRSTDLLVFRPGAAKQCYKF